MLRRRWTRGTAFAALLSSLSIYSAMAQPICQDILAGGAFRQLSRREDSYSSLVYASRLEQMSYQEAMRDFQANGGATIKGIPFSASMSEQQYNSSLQQLRQSVDLSTIRSNSTQLAVADGDPAIVSAWENCVSRLTGVIATMRSLDAQIIELSVTFRPFANASAPTIDPGTKVTNAEILAGSEFLRQGSNALGLANTRVITLRRTSPDAAVLAVINTNFGGATAYLPPRPPRTERPRPTIEVAAVDYRLGLSQNIAATDAPGNPNQVYGRGVGNGGPPWDQDRYNRAVYIVHAAQAGPYKLEINYAAGQSRPVQVQVRGPGGGEDQVYSNKLVATTGGWCLGVVPNSTEAACRVPNNHLQWSDAGTVNLRTGVNEIWIERGAAFPHLQALRLTYVGQ